MLDVNAKINGLIRSNPPQPDNRQHYPKIW